MLAFLTIEQAGKEGREVCYEFIEAHYWRVRWAMSLVVIVGSKEVCMFVTDCSGKRNV